MTRQLTARFGKAALAGLALLCAGAAGAADLGSPGLLPPAPELPNYYSWTGVYAGLQAGYGWGDGRLRIGTVPPLSVAAETDSAFGGAHAGFNYQFGSIVLGIEGDVEALDIRSRFGGAGIAGRVSQDWQGSARARIGYAFDRMMVYATGGLAFTEYERRVFDPATGFGERLTSARTGWNLGAGVNYAFTDNLILGAEYRYTDFGRNRFAGFGAGAFAGLTGDQTLTTHSARASIAYKF